VKFAIVAGEPSGDVLAAGLIREIKRRVPDATFYGIGGEKMHEEGFEIFYPMDSIAVMGIESVLKDLRHILKIRSSLRNFILKDKPDCFIGVDVPDFNLSLEKHIRTAGIRVVHYVSPSVWAWRGYRIKKIRRAIDHMLTLFPFEKQYYDRQHIPATFVGHPSADRAMAIRAEIDRQAEILDDGGAIQQATLGYDAEGHRLFLMRLKENADDYRYFPDPDLIPLMVGEERIEEIRAALPELPDQKRLRFESEYGLSAHDARLLSASRALADFFEAAARAHGTAKSVANWMLRDLLAALKEREIEIEEAAIAPEALARLIEMVDQGRVTAKSARDLVAELTEQGGDPEALVRERGLEAVSDAGLLESVADEVIVANPDAAKAYAEGDKKLVNFLMGQVMKKTQGKADPGRVREILARKLEE